MVGRDAVVVTVFCDDKKKYLSTSLTNEEQVEPECKTPGTEPCSVGTVGRACEFCHRRVVAHGESGAVTSTDIVRAPQPCHSKRSLRSEESLFDRRPARRNCSGKFSAMNEREVGLLRHGTHRDDELAAEQVLVEMIQRFRRMQFMSMH
jgi:hypothetical protein